MDPEYRLSATLEVTDGREVTAETEGVALAVTVDHRGTVTLALGCVMMRMEIETNISTRVTPLISGNTDNNAHGGQKTSKMST